VITPIEIFGNHLRELREQAKFSRKSFAYQIDLSLLEYTELEEGLSIKYMTGLRSCIAPYLLHIQEIPEKRIRFKELYDDAIKYQSKLDDEMIQSFKLTSDSESPERTIPLTPNSHNQIDEMVNEMDYI